ncbi:MAG: hypothetical protein KZQ96_02975 [Candidatus Thiodiazotropha sp. (ex Lucinoma borealis)]|nr:hypothetical protein [Candidatus Thiodiazotropha sp. (ex Lucinoma borealis)]MCU7867404.1 hypothetical protein [Candidatus Thiodiazotropha sp. (ex Lucinoma borealis)]
MLKDTFTIPISHPSLDGHFPGTPIVPGVVLLDNLLTLLNNRGFEVVELVKSKFIKPVQADQLIEVELNSYNNMFDFELKSGGDLIVCGQVIVNSLSL